MCEKYTKTELELDICKGREETFHSVILELNQEVITKIYRFWMSKTVLIYFFTGDQTKIHDSAI